MGVLVLSQDGKVYKDDFSAAPLDPTWMLSPNTPAAIDLGARAGFLRVLPGAELFVLRDMPTGNFLCEIGLDFTPLAAPDEAGLCIHSTAQRYIHLVRTHDGEVPITYTALRLERRGNEVRAYGYKNGWDYIGVTPALDYAKVGMFIGATSAMPLDVDYFALSLGRYIVINNLPDDVVVRFYNGEEQVAELTPVTGTVKQDVFNYSPGFVGGIKVIKTINEVETEVGSYTGEMWGGTRWQFAEVVLNLVINGGTETLHYGSEKYLGPLVDGLIEMPVLLYNPNNFTVNNIVIEPVKFQHYIGNEWAALALDNANAPGIYAGQIVIPQVLALDSVQFWLKIQRGVLTQLITDNMCKFALNILTGSGV